MHTKLRHRWRINGADTWHILLAIAFTVLVSVHGVVQANQTSGVTLTADVYVDDVNVNEIVLASLIIDSGEKEDVALRLVWSKDASSIFPVWKINLVSSVAVNLLPPHKVARPVSGVPDLVETELVRSTPAPAHVYKATVSYSSDMGSLAIKLEDKTDGTIVYAGGFDVPSFDQQLDASFGHLTPRYLPIAMSWSTGIDLGGGQSITSNRYETRDELAIIRMSSPSATPGKYQIYVEQNGDDYHLLDFRPDKPESMIPLPLDEIPLGHSAIRVDYVENDEVLLSDSKMVGLGRINVWMDRLVPVHDSGIVETVMKFGSIEFQDDDIEVDVSATLYELVWDSRRRNFDEIEYDQFVLYQGSVDLAGGSALVPLQFDMPDIAASWKIVFDTETEPKIDTRSENDRYFSTYASADVHEGDPYTVAVFPDTQYFAQSYPWIYTRMSDWVAANAAELNISALLHVGDITDKDTAAQWINAHDSMSLLHGVVPYVLTLGNHDMTAGNIINGSGGQTTYRGLSLINDFFSVDEARRYSNLAGTMFPDRLENHYHLFSIAGDDYVVIALEFGPPNEALAWASEVAEKYPDHRMVLLTHSYTSKEGGLSPGARGFPIAKNPETTVNSGPEMWSKFVSRHANSFMVISGHTSPSVPTIPHRLGRAMTGQPVYELLFDHQFQPMGGNGWLGLMTFYPNGTVDIRLYSPFLGEYANEKDEYGFGSHLILDLNTNRVIPIFE